MTTSEASSLIDGLVDALGGDASRVADGDSELDLHSEDLTFHEPRRPDVVVYPTSTDEVARVLELAEELRVPVTPFAAATSLEGHVIPVAGGISLDLTRMNGVVQIEPENMAATVQPGVTRSALNEAAGGHGLFFPVDPGADATIGGMAATNAAGTTTPRYGKMRPNVLALEAVLPGGHVIRTGSHALKTSAGYDVTGLLVGSEGTLGVITEVTVRLYGIPEHAVAVRISFPSVEAAARAAVAAVAVGAGVTRLELLDTMNIKAINAYSDTSYPEAPCLFVEATGTEASIEGDLELMMALAEEEGAVEIAHEREADARSQLWSARHNAAYSWSRLWPGRRHCSTDVAVPLSELPAAIAVARQEVERLGLRGGILGHVGDGNFHVGAMVDPESPEEIEAFAELSRVLVDDAISRGGTSTGEHGVGAGKLAALEREHGDLLPLMRGIKAQFDPHGIMNPGKVLPAAKD